MLNSGKITQATYEYLVKDLNVAVKELQARKKTLTKEATPKANALEKKIAKEFYKRKEVTLDPSRNASPHPLPALVNTADTKKQNKTLKECVTNSEKTLSAPTKKVRIRVRKKKKISKKASAKRSTSRKSRQKDTLRWNCKNPWNGKCRSTNTEVIIYYENKRLPICQDCWYEIVDKNITW